MTNVQSKFWHTVSVDCQPHLHPWSKSCTNATLGLIIHTLPFCFRVYAVFYGISLLISLLKRSKKINLKYIFMGYLRSTAFLTTNGASFCLYNCLLRYILGSFNRFSVAFLPAFLGSLTAILIESPARRGILSLYVANVATETLWNMAISRGLVQSQPHGECYVFAVGISILIYLYRISWHMNEGQSDAIYQVIKFFIAPAQTKPINGHREKSPLGTQTHILRNYMQFVDFLKHKRSNSCAHGTQSCFLYSLKGGTRAFILGICMQFGFTLLASKGNLGIILQPQFKSKALQLSGFLGCFSLTYRTVTCLLRYAFGFDDPRFAVAAGLIASINFRQYPNKTVAIYVMWKMLQQVYNLVVVHKKCPKVPGFAVILYAICTAILFHAAIMEPKTVRPSYFKFLYGISGERLCKFNLEPFDAFGHSTTQNMQEVMNKLNIVIKSPLPKGVWP